MKDDMVMSSASINDDGKSLHLRFVVHNPAGRTRHVYTSIRALRYDETTKMLEVQMSDHGLMEPRDRRNPSPDDVSSANFILPHMTDVAAGADAEISIHVPRTITRIDTNAPPAAVLRLETLQVHEAQTVQVNVAWGETPFYSDPREPFQMRKQLTEWAKGVCHYTIHRNAPDKPPSASPNDPPTPPREGPYRGETQNGRKSLLPKRNKRAKDKE